MATGLGQYGFGAKTARYADAGKYFVATNPTPGTGIASGAVTTLADTTPYLVIKNNNTVASGIKMYLDFWRLTLTAAGGGGSVRNMTFKLDASQTTTRYTSGGTSIGAGVNTSADSGNASNAQVYLGAITAAAAGSARLIGHVMLREIIEIVNDTFLFDFGTSNHQASAYLPTGGTLTTARYFSMPPIVIGPQEHLLAHYWGTSLTAATFENLIGWVEV
jgi:hypothetical protein